jgi:Thrombospondin type 3 repeat
VFQFIEPRCGRLYHLIKCFLTIYYQFCLVIQSREPQQSSSDRDHDNIPDNADNCVDKSNPDQRDSDRDKHGDVCDNSDRDGVLDTTDNYPIIHNPDEADTDGDGI